MLLTVEVNQNDTGPREHYLGRSDHSQSDIEVGEIISYDRVLTDAERISVEEYLSEKWGIAYGSSAGGGANELMKMGSGTVTLNGANTYIGETMVTAGTLIAGSDTALGTGDGGTTVMSDEDAPNSAALGLQGGITISGESSLSSTD